MAERNVEGAGRTVGELFGKHVGYSMPPFQRNYVWGEDNLEEYWGDLENLIKEEKSNETSFLGALVLQEGDVDGKSSKELKRYTVIDGQQRLTTFYLTLLALLAYAIERYQELHKQQKDEGHVDLRDFSSWVVHAGSDELRDHLFSREANSERAVRLRPSLSDYAQFNAILSKLNVGLKGYEKLTRPKEKASPKLLSDKQKGTGNLFRAYGTLHGKIKSFIESDGDKAEWEARYYKILNALVNKTEVVQIVTKSNLSPYEIFDRLNTSGIRLGTLDVVRNYTFGKAILGGDDAEKSEKFSTEVWRPFENQLKDVSIKTNLKFYESFFVAYGAINIENFTTRKKDIHLKEYWNGQIKTKRQQKPYGGAELIVDSLDEYLPPYLAICARKEPDNIHEDLWCLIESIRDISLPEATYPFLMPVLRSSIEKKLPVANAIQAFEIIESFIVRLTLLGRSMASLTAVFQPLWESCGAEGMTPESILRDIEDKYSLSWPDDDEIRRNILSVPVYNQKRAKYILTQYEKWWQEKNGAAEVSLVGCHIDHIMPRAKAGEGDLKQPEEKERENLLCDTLGNLTLLDRKINLSKSAKELEKDDGETGEGEEKSVRKLLKGSSFASVKALLNGFDKREEKRWEVKSIEKRGEELAEWAIERWPLEAEKLYPNSPHAKRVKLKRSR